MSNNFNDDLHHMQLVGQLCVFVSINKTIYCRENITGLIYWAKQDGKQWKLVEAEKALSLEKHFQENLIQKLPEYANGVELITTV